MFNILNPQSQNGGRISVITLADANPATNDTKEFSIKDLLKEIETNKDKIKLETASNQAKILDTDGEILIKAVSKEKKIDFTNAFLGIAIIC
jgi:hypothetical protein